MVWDPIRSSPGSGIAFPEAPAEARKTQKSLKKLVRSTKVTKPKLRGSWGGKLEAEAVLGVAKPTVRGESGKCKWAQKLKILASYLACYWASNWAQEVKNLASYLALLVRLRPGHTWSGPKLLLKAIFFSCVPGVINRHIKFVFSYCAKGRLHLIYNEQVSIYHKLCMR